MTRPVSVFLALALIVSAGAIRAADPTPQEKAEGDLALAQSYIAGGEIEKAEPLLTSALQAVPQDTNIRKRVTESLSRLVADRRTAAEARQRLLLAEAQRLVIEGKSKEARELIHGKLDILDPRLFAEADNRLATIHRNWLRGRLSALVWEGWPLDFGFAVLLLLALMAFLWCLQRLIAWIYRNEWLVMRIEDTTNLGVGLLAFERMIRWSEERPTASAGMLKLDMLRVQVVPRIEQDRPDISFSTALADLPAVGQVNLGATAKFFGTLRSLVLGRRPSISIAAHTLDQQAVVRLTRRAKDGKICTVTAVGAKTVEGLAAAGDSASFKMYYLLANNAPLPQVEAADRLRLGLESLQRYLTHRDPASLRSSYEVFREVRSQSPGFEEAQLYEGVALDMMERHDEAESVFKFLTEHGHGDVKTRALYNGAVARFRKYRPEELEVAIQMLEELIGREILDDLEASPPRLDRLSAAPIPAMAVAAKANAIAHKPIFWQTIIYKDRSRDDAKVLDRKVRAQHVLFGWIEEVDHLTGCLLRLGEMSLSARNRWDSVTQKQLLWSSHNAIGNVRLNVASTFLVNPPLPGVDESVMRSALLNRAYHEFQACILLLPAGVETLTNLATTLLKLSRTEEARNYAQEAIKTNPDYEYAYYRLAQTWEEDKQPGKVVETLRNFRARRPPKISEFKELFEMYHYDLASP